MNNLENHAENENTPPYINCNILHTLIFNFEILFLGSYNHLYFILIGNVYEIM